MLSDTSRLSKMRKSRSNRNQTRAIAKTTGDGSEKGTKSDKGVSSSRKPPTISSRRKRAKPRKRVNKYADQQSYLPLSLDELPADLKNKVESLLTDLSGAGYESMVVVLNASTSEMTFSGSSLGKQYLEKFKKVQRDFYKFCEESIVEEPEKLSPSPPKAVKKEDVEPEKVEADDGSDTDPVVEAQDDAMSDDDNDDDNGNLESSMETSTHAPEDSHIDDDSDSEDFDYSAFIDYLKTDTNPKSTVSLNTIEEQSEADQAPEAKLDRDPEFNSLSMTMAVALENMDKFLKNLEPNKDGDFECTFCDKKWPHKYRILRHIRGHLEAMKKTIVSCDICDSRLPQDFIHLHKAAHRLSEKHIHECFTQEQRDIRNDVAYFIGRSIRYNEEVECRYCSRKFCGYNNLKKHFMFHHTTRHVCKVCGIGLFDHKKLSRHARIHSVQYRLENAAGQPPVQIVKVEVERFPCMDCDDKYASESALYWHIDKKHPDLSVNTHHCTMCKRSFISEGTLALHMKTHQQTYMCPHEGCGRVFRSSRDVISHKRIHDKDKRRCLCSICGATYSNKMILQEHIDYSHNGKEPLKCDHCPAQYRTYNSYRKHIQVHTNEATMVCELCGDKFKTTQHLWQHKRSRHTVKKKHTCITCQRVFCKYESLEIHLCNENHFSAEQPESMIKYKTCQTCGKVFPNTKQLKRHRENKHDKPRECTFCGKHFNDSSNLRQHIKSHTNSQPRCPLCNLVFRSKVKLTEHVDSIHLGFKKLPESNVEQPQQPPSNPNHGMMMNETNLMISKVESLTNANRGMMMDDKGLIMNKVEPMSTPMSTETLQAVTTLEYEALLGSSAHVTETRPTISFIQSALHVPKEEEYTKKYLDLPTL